jgi:putative membrane protein
MMFWDRHYDVMGWWPMAIWIVIWLLIIGLLVWIAVRAIGNRTSAPPSQPAAGDMAEELLRRRFATGEIDEEEFTKRLEALRRK